MKKILPFLMLALGALLGFTGFATDTENKVLPEHRVLHVGIVVKDIETSLDSWIKLLDLKQRPPVQIAEGHVDNPTHYKEQPSDAKAKLAFMTLDNLKIELIEPIGGPSHWKDFLDAKGEGVHHLAFEVKDIGERYIDAFETIGHPVVQQGGWNGGEYSYMDGISKESSLAVMIELIEHYKK